LSQIGPLVRPYVNATRRRTAYGLAAVRSRLPLFGTPSSPAFTFILGCGRSGTTMLGDLLRIHPEVAYLFEPFALWAAVDARTDVTHVYSDAAVGIVLDERDWTASSQSRFDRLFASAAGGKPQLIEKSPRNTMRIGYLRRLAPGCRFVHIVRSGPDVARSIARYAERNADHPQRQRRQINSWWGVRDAKWRALCFDAAQQSSWPDEMPAYRDHQTRGACEWLMSIEAVDRRKRVLGDHLLEVRYDDVTSSPGDALLEIADFLQIDPAPTWLDGAVELVRPSPDRQVTPLALPSALVSRLNEWQERYGFAERVVDSAGQP